MVAAIKKGSEKNVVCCKTLLAKEEAKDEVAALCEGITAFSKAAMVDRNTGIMSFECTRDMYEDHVFYFWERYVGNSAMGKHNTTPEMNNFMEAVNAHLQQPVGMALYEWRDGQLGHACIQGGPKGEGGLDDATGAGGAGGASMKQSSAVVNLGTVESDEERTTWGIKMEFPWFKKDKKADEQPV